MTLVWILESLEIGMARILGSDTLCLAMGTYTQGAGDSYARRASSDA